MCYAYHLRDCESERRRGQNHHRRWRWGPPLPSAVQRVLLVDLDPQAGLTISHGVDPDLGLEQTVYQVFLEEASLARRHPSQRACPRVGPRPRQPRPGWRRSRGPLGEIGWDRTLAEALAAVAGDPMSASSSIARPRSACSPPMPWRAADVVLVTAAMRIPGPARAQAAPEDPRRRCAASANPHLQVRILRTMYDSRTTHAREVFDEIAQAGGEQVLRTFIRRTVKFADAAASGASILHHATDSEAAHAYLGVGDRSLTRMAARKHFRPSAARAPMCFWQTTRPKRPSLPSRPSDNKRVMATFYLPPALVDRLDRAWLARRMQDRKVQKSHLVAEALDAYLQT